VVNARSQVLAHPPVDRFACNGGLRGVHGLWRDRGTGLVTWYAHLVSPSLHVSHGTLRLLPVGLALEVANSIGFTLMLQQKKRTDLDMSGGQPDRTRYPVAFRSPVCSQPIPNINPLTRQNSCATLDVYTKVVAYTVVFVTKRGGGAMSNVKPPAMQGSEALPTLAESVPVTMPELPPRLV